MVRYWILRQKPLPVQFKQALWLNSRKGKIKQVKRNILALDEHNKLKSQIPQIMDESRHEESSSLRGFEEKEYRQQSDTSILPPNEKTKTIATRPGLPRPLLSTDSKRNPNETCPEIGIVYTQNVQGLTGKDKGLESLVDPIVYLMIKDKIMVYCIQETWTLGSCSTLVRGHMVVRHNQEELTIGTKGRIQGGVAIILSPTECKAWRAGGSKPPITTPIDSPFVGRFIGVKLRIPRIDPYKKKIRGNTTLFVASIYHPVDELEHT